MPILQTLDIIIYYLLLIPCIYLGIFSIASLFHKKKGLTPQNISSHRYIVLYPAYKEDAVIVQSVQTFFKQNYPRELYDLIVISDQMQETTNQQLRNLSAKVLIANYENSSKTKALRMAVNYIEEQKKKYDYTVIMDADNLVSPSFLQELDASFNQGKSKKAIQAHRTAKNLNTDIAILDAVSEEINNSIFRKGHNVLNLSASLIGSGMAFDYHWFKENIFQVGHVGEDKQIEFQLMKQSIFVEYLNDTLVQDEKVQKMTHFNTQRRRWIATQFVNLIVGIKELPKAIVSGNLDLFNTVFQWMLPPRLILLGVTFLYTFIISFINCGIAYKWWGLLAGLIILLLIATPKRFFNDKLLKAILHLPALFLVMFINLFRIKGAHNKFIHTEHTI